VSENDDMFIFAILTHGVKEEVHGADGHKVPTSFIFEKFNNERCPALKAKPKYFIIQACRLENEVNLVI
jgi:hypothetical protein